MPAFTHLEAPRMRRGTTGVTEPGQQTRPGQHAGSGRHVGPGRSAEELQTGRGLSRLGLFTILLGVFLPMTDFFIVNVALPTIDRDLHASSGMLQLVVAGYTIAYAVLLVVGGRLGDTFGRRRLFLAGMAGFTLASLACGIAPTAAILVAVRALQGATAAMMVPQVLSTVQAKTEGVERARALGMFGACGGVATVTGQLVGGLLVSANIAGTGWRPIFLVNVPIGIVGLILASRVVPETHSPAPARIDIVGTTLLASTLLMLLVPLTEGRSLGWPLWTVALLCLCPVTGAGFVFAERRLERAGGVPLVPFSLLRVPSMRRGLMLAVPFFTGFGGFMFVYALTLQDGAHFSPLKTGASLVPFAVAFLVASLSTARLVSRFGHRVVTTGAVMQAIGLVGLGAAYLATWPGLSPELMMPGLVMTGFGQGLVMSPMFRVVLSEVQPTQAGAASGVLTTMLQSSLALGVATLGSLYLTESPAAHLGNLSAAILTLGLLVAIAALVALLSRRLPD
ncbi:MAG TPA: MFS transporter [Streptosporangiaceae bacterium]|nr:MFS transporter [Streptosporangiaceae bacterium]